VLTVSDAGWGRLLRGPHARDDKGAPGGHGTRGEAQAGPAVRTKDVGELGWSDFVSAAVSLSDVSLTTFLSFKSGSSIQIDDQGELTRAPDYAVQLTRSLTDLESTACPSSNRSPIMHCITYDTGVIH